MGDEDKGLERLGRALLSLGYDFLARRSELTALEVGDIKFSEGGSATDPGGARNTCAPG